MFGSAQVSVDVRLQIGYDIQGDHESSAFYSGQVRPHPHQKVAMFDINDVWHLNKRTVWSGWSACNMLQCWQCYISSTSACDPVILITDAASDSARKAPRNDPESPLLRWYWLSKWGGSHFGNFPVSADRFVMIFFDDSRGKRRPHFRLVDVCRKWCFGAVETTRLSDFLQCFCSKMCVCVWGSPGACSVSLTRKSHTHT